jgi:formate dehydrogenase iron-sulfur subunit
MAATALAGLFAVFCSAMIYVDTRRELWRAQRTLPLFFLTTVVIGGAMLLVFDTSNAVATAVVIAASLLKLVIECAVVRRVTDRSFTPMKKTALLVSGAFQHLAFARLCMLLVGGVGIPLLLSVDVLPIPKLVAAAALALLVAGELAERYLFFCCVVAPKMPGGVRA